MAKLLLKPGQFRLLLAGMVLLSHLTALSTGRLGVLLFFVLSGYWISDLWERQRTERSAKYLFFLNRFLRIWPLYFIVVVVACTMLNRAIHPANVLIFGVASSAGPRPLGVEWSLDIEAQFYLLLPLLIAIRPTWWLIVPTTALGWLTWRYADVTNVFMYLPAFGAGMVCYRRKSSRVPVSWQAAFAGFVALTGVLAITAPGRAMFSSKIPDVMNEDIFAMVWGIPLVIYIAHSLRLKSGPIDRHLGNLSFPLYLVHEPVIQVMRLSGVTAKGVIVVVAFVVALALYVTLDVPIENIRHEFLKRLKARLTDRASAARRIEDIQSPGLEPSSAVRVLGHEPVGSAARP